MVISGGPGKLLQERRIIRGDHTSSMTERSLNHDVNSMVLAITDNRPSNPGNSPGVGHLFGRKNLEKKQ